MTIIHDPPTCVARADELAQLGERMRGFVTASKAPATLRAYRTGLAAFATWCDRRGLTAMPATPSTVAAYATDMAGLLAVGTIGGRLSSISVAHQQAGYDNPTADPMVRTTMAGIRRTFGVATIKKQALETRDVRAMAAALGDGVIDVRDRALLLVAFAGALRRSEVAALNVDDIDVTDGGLEVVIRRSKTEEGRSVRLGLPYGSDPATCPVRAVRAWLDWAAITDGPVFRQVTRHGHIGGRMSGRAVAERIKVLAARVGHDPARIGGHSTRRGFITSAARAKVLERDIMRHSRHRSIAVMRSYIEGADVWTDNAAVAVGL
jgi:integrase